MTRLEVQLSELARQIDRQVHLDERIHSASAGVMERLSARLAEEEDDRQQLAADFRVFTARLIVIVAIAAVIGQFLLAVFGPAVRATLHLP